MLFVFSTLALQSCGGGESGANKFTENSSDLSDLVKIIDINSNPNQIEESASENGIEIGITANAKALNSNVSYSLLESAGGRFSIDSSTGIVFLTDYLLLNAAIYPQHTITVQAKSDSGAVQSSDFLITVIPADIPMSPIVDIDNKANEVLELIKLQSQEIGITAQVKNSDDNVIYQLIETSKNRFKIDENSGVVTVVDNTEFNAIKEESHAITVKASNNTGSNQSKEFDIKVLNNYENNFPTVSTVNSLMNWNDGDGQRFSGWEWHDDVAYGNPGWLLNDDGPIEGGERYTWGWGVRSSNKGDYGKQNTAIIDNNSRSPSTNIGGSLKVMETADSTDHRSTWWIWYDGKPLSERNITNNKTDRMSFYLKTTGMDGINDDGGKESIGNNFHIGTYLCWQTGNSAYGTGDGCPYEGPGNQHYYHYLAINPGAWIHVLLDQHPQHIRGGKGTLKNNPAMATYQKNYFEQMSRFYFEIRAKQSAKTSFNIDELNYFSSDDMVEPNQNEESISSLWVGYWADKDVWEIGFHDNSHEAYNDDNNSTFEIRWSTSPITNKNFDSAFPITPMFYGGLEKVGENSEHLIRRPNGWSSNVWTRFELPDAVENNYLKVFFAVKDVSIKGAHIGTKWPYNKGDGHNAPTSNIKIIDYYLKPEIN